MNIERFKKNLIPIISDPAGDIPFYALRMITNGLSSPKTARIINFATRCCSESEIYCEVGTYTGYTLVSAAYQTFSTCIGIDNFVVDADKEKLRLGVQTAINKSFNKKVSFIESDFKDISLCGLLKDDCSIGVYYIDGDHSYESTNAMFEWAYPRLSDNAIIIVDDLNMDSVQRSVIEQLASGKYSLVAWLVNLHDETESMYQVLDGVFSMGIAILVKRKKDIVNA